MLEKLISSFIRFTCTRHIFAGIDSTGLKIDTSIRIFCRYSQIEKEICANLSIGPTNSLKQIICNIKVRRAPTTRHDT